MYFKFSCILLRLINRTKHNLNASVQMLHTLIWCHFKTPYVCNLVSSCSKLVQTPLLLWFFESLLSWSKLMIACQLHHWFCSICRKWFKEWEICKCKIHQFSWLFGGWSSDFCDLIKCVVSYLKVVQLYMSNYLVVLTVFMLMVIWDLNIELSII